MTMKSAAVVVSTIAMIYPHQYDDDTEYAREVRKWVMKIPVGLGLCPWAGTAAKRGLLRISTCDGDTPTAVTHVLEHEIKLLIDNNGGTTPPPLSTTLLVCPHVKTWVEFQPFDDFIRSIGKNNKSTLPLEMMHLVTLVAFHPKFLRWHALPEDISIGSTVQSHWGILGKKSVQTATATIIETKNRAFGLRKVKVRFHNVELFGSGVDNRNQEQFVPTDWILASNENCAPPPLSTRTQLPDNSMHQSPYPTIHIIVNQDLASLCIRDVSRVKRLNAQRMTKLGWEGLARILGNGDDMATEEQEAVHN